MTPTSEEAKLTFAGFVLMPADPMWPVLQPAPYPGTLLEAVLSLDSLEAVSPIPDALQDSVLGILEPLEPLEAEESPAWTLGSDLDGNLEDSGFLSSSHSRKTSESSGSDWEYDSPSPSVAFPSLSINPTFNIWSPSNGDELILLALSTSLPSFSDLGVSSDSETNSEQWGDFEHWAPVPTPSEVAVLMAREELEEAAIHARAAEKRQRKKEVFFAKVHARRDKKILNVHSHL